MDPEVKDLSKSSTKLKQWQKRNIQRNSWRKSLQTSWVFILKLSMQRRMKLILKRPTPRLNLMKFQHSKGRKKILKTSRRNNRKTGHQKKHTWEWHQTSHQQHLMLKDIGTIFSTFESGKRFACFYSLIFYK